MSQTVELVTTSLVIMAVMICAVMIGGEPDIADAIRRYIDAQAENSRCERTKSEVFEHIAK